MVAVFALLGPTMCCGAWACFFQTGGGHLWRAYAVLAYMAQQAVTAQHWLSAAEMADGLGLAETTPGPLIMVTQFVGYLAAFRAPAPLRRWWRACWARVDHMGDLAPCFLWVFALAPWIERLEHAQLLKGALALVTSAIVGVIANLSAWFALQVLFHELRLVWAASACRCWQFRLACGADRCLSAG
jgi:chromate transporter